MPETSGDLKEKEAANPSPPPPADTIGSFAELVKATKEYGEILFQEERFPALALVLIIVSLVIVSASIELDNYKLFLWLVTIPLLLILFFVLLPMQGRRRLKLKNDLAQLRQDHSDLLAKQETWLGKAKEAREQYSEMTVQSLDLLDSIKSRLDDIKVQLSDFLVADTSGVSEEEIRKLDEEVDRLLTHIRLNREQIDGIQARLAGVESMFDSSDGAAGFLANL
ncbi:hypothetical protein D0962_37435 [Leptolyngbyaceae cyanobacterium CCMR0082]|uniref:Uncharacterized protein n=1 Tax=Adonisia turfae CCMR0082 TaxID=2304604 RepID=A0A6M0SJB9_9CYAN|nr:hypothetical protein [Adonisia turfae]NEZ68346.1 hypothetical protein [Adonisia turfae CCMR0082]